MESFIHVNLIYLRRLMRKLINRLICLFRGHDYDLAGMQFLGIGAGRKIYVGKRDEVYWKCARCGKIKEEII